MDLFLNTEINLPHGDCLEHAADFCLKPVRYLFNGKTIEGKNYKNITIKDSFSEKQIWKTALAIALFIPAFIVGFVLKLIASCSIENRQDRSWAVHFLDAEKNRVIDAANPFTPPQYTLPPTTSLKQLFNILDTEKMGLVKKLTSKEMWSDPNIVREYSGLVEKSYKYADFLLQRVHQIAKTKMETEGLLRNDGKDDKHIGIMMAYIFDYCFNEFNSWYFDGLPKIYRLGACSIYFKDDKAVIYDQNKEHRAAFFQKGTEQYKCRRLFNSFWDLLAKYHVREPLIKVDDRLTMSAEQDLCKAGFCPNPSQPNRAPREDGDPKTAADIPEIDWEHYIRQSKFMMVEEGLLPESEKPKPLT